MTSFPARIPVLIVGAGPIGLTLANLLGSEGVDVLVVERNGTTCDLPRAVALDDEGARTLDAAGLTPRINDITFEGEGSRYYLEDGTCFASVGAGRSIYGFAKRQYFHQPDLERVLLEGARRFERIRLSFSSNLTAFEQAAGGVVCSIETPDGELHRVEAQYLLACDGGSSPVRTALGIGMRGDTYRQDWIVLDLADDSDQVRFSRFYCDPARPWVSIPAPYGGRRYEFMLLDGENGDELLELEALRRLLHGVRSLRADQIIREAIYTFHARIAESYRDRRVLLLGDAAHMTPPFAGQGMNAGLRDAHNVAWKVAAVLRGHASPALLDSYERERRDPTWAMVQLAVAMGDVVMPVAATGATFRNALVEGLEKFPAARDFMLEMRFKPKPRYSDGVFVGLDDPARLEASLVGQMIPQPRVRLSSGEVCALDQVLGTGFGIIAQDDAGERALGSLRHPLWKALAPRLLSFAAGEAPPRNGVLRCAPLDADLHRPFRTHRDELLLVRPDRYAAGVFNPLEADRFADAMSRLFES